MAKFENKKRQDVEFNVGAMVLLHSKNLRLPSKLTKKFAQKYIGPYKIVKKISAVAYELELP